MTAITRPAITLDEAYRQCGEIVRGQAKNFSYGIRLLPASKRRALSVVYALARRIDDIGDVDPSTGRSVEQRVGELETVRLSMGALRRDGRPSDQSDPVLVALSDAARRYPIPLEAFEELVDGCIRDLSDARYRTLEDLVGYCRLVAGSISRLSLGIFGTVPGVSGEEASRRADALGVALQLTNILRDIVEDRDVMGRVYIPLDHIERFGCRADLTGPPEALTALVRFEVTQARAFYEEGAGLLPLLDHRARACVAAMAGIYRRLLQRIDRDPVVVFHDRISLPTWEKGWVAARALTLGAA